MKAWALLLAVGGVAIVVPGGDAGDLMVHRHGATMIGAIAQKARNQFGIAGHEAGTQAGQVGAFGQTVKNHATPIITTTQCSGRGE